MLGKTHIAVGVAATILVTQPQTTPEVICAVAGGAVGGWISDIDGRNNASEEGMISGLVFSTLIAGVAFLVDRLMGSTIIASIAHSWGIKSYIGLAGIILFIILGLISNHRTFTHSIPGIAFLTGAVFLLSDMFAMPLLVGCASHIIIDLTNKTGIRLLYPLKPKLCLNLCDSDGTANSVIFGLASIAAVVESALFFVMSLSKQDVSISLWNSLNQESNLFGLSKFVLYMIIINVVTFVVFLIDYFICSNTTWEDDEEWGQDFIHTVLNFFAILGGAFGMLLSFIALRQKIGKHNANWYAIAFSLVIVWSVIICIVRDPFAMGFGSVKPGIANHIPLICYLGLVNLLSMFFFIKDRNRSRPKWNGGELGLFVLGLIGGAFAGLLVIVVTDKKSHSPLFSFGFPVILAAQTVLVGYLLLAGIA